LRFDIVCVSSAKNGEVSQDQRKYILEGQLDDEERSHIGDYEEEGEVAPIVDLIVIGSLERSH